VPENELSWCWSVHGLLCTLCVPCSPTIWLRFRVLQDSADCYLKRNWLLNLDQMVRGNMDWSSMHYLCTSACQLKKIMHSVLETFLDQRR
jgi:hypothetical protein